ncbi:MAG: ArsA family ATPase [Spirochaetes bacterium]|nr:MAG: ArsA family ATPase [Spirochaetota bacterium]
MKVIFFIGKGGVGKSTSSAIFAYNLAKAGNTVLLDSIDPAHNLHDIFSTKLGVVPKNVMDGLSVMETNLDQWVKKYLQETEKEFKEVYKYQEAFNLHKYFRTLKYSPGLEEYAVLLALQDTIEKYSDRDYIIFDTPPTALTLKFLALPSVSLLWLMELVKFRQMILDKKEIVTKIKEGKKGAEVEKDPVLNRIEDLIRVYQKLADLFADSIDTKIILVMNPDKLSLSESRDITAQLMDLKMTVPYIILNKFEGDESICKTLENDFIGTEVIRFKKNDSEIIGLDRIEEYSLSFDLNQLQD